MRFLHYIPQALLFLGYAVAGDTADKESAVISLTAANFDRVANAQPVMLVAFVSSKSVDCEALAPEYEKAAKMLGDPLGIVLASVDCADQADLCAKHRVEDFPHKFNGTAEKTEFGDCASLLVLRHGTVISSYEGPVEFDEIFRFVVKLPVPAAIEVTATNHDDVKASANVVFIGYMSWSSETSATIFSDVAERQRDGSVFGLCTDEATIAAAGVTPPAVVAYRKFDVEPRVVFKRAEFTARELRDFVYEHSLPLVGDVGALGYLRYRKTGLPLAFLFIERDDPEHAQYVATLRRAAEKYRGRIAFGYTASRRYPELFGFSGGGEGAWPVFAIQYRNGAALPWVVRGPNNPLDVLAYFIDDFAAGALLPRADLVAASASQGTNVRDVGGSEFDTVVFDDAKDVFVEVYASRECRHCMRLKPTWDVLGDKYAEEKDRITIARIDVETSRNDLPFSVTGVPWLRFKKAGTRDFVDFQGGRSLAALVTFIETHATNPLSVDLSSEVVVPSGEDAQREFHSIN